VSTLRLWQPEPLAAAHRGVRAGPKGYRVVVMAKLKIGDTAPDFELPVRGKETVRLSEALKRGPVVLLTYILDFSPG
jgi:AhpC/TSA family